MKIIKPSSFYPLPEDYLELTEDGQRLARVNACRQWLVNGTPQQKADAFAASVKFFDTYYLNPDPENDFDCLFYDDEPLLSPKGHWDILRQWASSSRNIAIAPRGFAKSFLVRKSILLRMLTRPMYTILYATSTNDNAKGTGQSIKDQFQNNSRIHDDWSEEFNEGRIIPRRGEAPFGTELMQLRNGSWLRCISSESRQRGGRPRRYILDDPEYDPRASTSMSVLRSYMDSLLFKVVLPMVMRAGCGVDWLATFVSRRHYAWHALQTKETDPSKAQDPRFDLWSRMIIRAAYEDEQGDLQSCWPEMWPPSRQYKKDNPSVKDRVSLEEIKEIIGTSNFMAEYMANPGYSADNFFPELTRETNGWWLEKVDENWKDTPTISQTLICWEHEHLTHKVPFIDFIANTRAFMTVDTSYTATKDSDRKVACVMALNSDNVLFVLDIWSGRCHQNDLVRKIVEIANKWRVPTIHPEAIRQGLGLITSLQSIYNTKMVDTDHTPAIKKLNPGMMDKNSKIANLQYRIENGLLKIPLESSAAPFRRLVDQFEQFNPEVRDGGLQHDDEIDSVCMSQFVIKVRLNKPWTPGNRDKTPEELMDEGILFDPITQTEVINQMDFRKIPVEKIIEWIDREGYRRKNDGRSKV